MGTTERSESAPRWPLPAQSQLSLTKFECC